METAALSKNEQTDVERMSEGFGEPTAKERFEVWASRAIADAKQEKKKEKKQHRPREVELEGKSDEEKKFWEGGGEKVETKDSEKESPAKSSAEKDELAAKAGVKATSDSTKAPSEPLSADFAERHWQGKLQGEEIARHIDQVGARAGVIMDFLGSHPQKSEMEKGFKHLFAGRPPAQQQEFFRDLTACLAEVPDPAGVFRHITMQPQDLQHLRQVKTAKELRAAIQTIARHYPAAAAKAPEVRPRAPKPPSEVGGRMAAGDDGTRGAGDFSDFSSRQSQRYGR